MSGSDGDDNVAVGSGSTNVSVTHNRFFAGHGESIGSITTAGLSNILFDSNMNYGDADVDGSNSTAVRIKSADDRGGNVNHVQYSNSCFANHGTQMQFNTLYNTTAGTTTPNFNNILLQNLRFVSGVPFGTAVPSPVATGSATFQGAINGATNNPLTLTLDNVTMDTAPTLASPNYAIGHLQCADQPCGAGLDRAFDADHRCEQLEQQCDHGHRQRHAYAAYLHLHLPDTGDHRTDGADADHHHRRECDGRGHPVSGRGACSHAVSHRHGHHH